MKGRIGRKQDRTDVEMASEKSSFFIPSIPVSFLVPATYMGHGLNLYGKPPSARAIDKIWDNRPNKHGGQRLRIADFGFEISDLEFEIGDLGSEKAPALRFRNPESAIRNFYPGGPFSVVQNTNGPLSGLSHVDAAIRVAHLVKTNGPQRQFRSI